MNKRYSYRALLMSHFSKRWHEEYLIALRERHLQFGNNTEVIKVGDIVQIHDDTPRVNWRLAVVEKLLRGNDERVRAAEIRTAKGRTNRLINKLYPLEIRACTDQSSVTPLTEEVASPESRPRRAAAAVAAERIRNIARREYVENDD